MTADRYWCSRQHRGCAAAAIILAATPGWHGIALGATATIGRTWPIAEPDALAEIEAKAAALPHDLRNRFGPRARWSAMKAAALGPVTAARVRTIVPFYTLDIDVTLPDGRVLYPKGFMFNPLTYVSLPQRLVIVHANELGWAAKMAAPSDWILLAAGSGPGPDPIALGEKLGRPLFLLEPRVKERLGLTVAPVIVRQIGQRLELSEVLLDRNGSARR